MIRAGLTTNNPQTGSRWTVLESDVETKGMGWKLEIRCLPNAGPDILEHLHLTWTETFEIISGLAHYKLDGVRKTATAGDTIVMPPGQPHIHPWNAGNTEMVYHQINKFEQPDPQAIQDVLGVFVTLFGLTAEGKIGKRGLPKNPLQFAATVRTLVKYDGYDAHIPIPAQKILAATLGRLAEAMGYKAIHPQYGTEKLLP